MTKFFNKIPKWLKYSLFVFIIIDIIWCILLYLPTIPLFKSFNDDTGKIWDTFSWIINPFLTLVSIILIYITINEQVKANKEIYKQNQMIAEQFEKSKISDAMDRIYQEIKYDIDNFYYKDTKTKFRNYEELRENQFKEPDILEIEHMWLKWVQYVVHKIIIWKENDAYLKNDIFNLIVLSEKLIKLINTNKDFEYSKIMKELLWNLLLRAIYREIIVKFENTNSDDWRENFSFIKNWNNYKSFTDFHIEKIIKVYKDLWYPNNLD